MQRNQTAKAHQLVNRLWSVGVYRYSVNNSFWVLLKCLTGNEGTDLLVVAGKRVMSEKSERDLKKKLKEMPKESQLILLTSYIHNTIVELFSYALSDRAFQF